MNKNLLKICFVIALTMCAVSAYGTSTISSPIQLGGGSFAPSTKVTIEVDSGATSYGAFSLHSSGDHEYATTSSAPNFWYKTVAVGTGFTGTLSSTMVLDSQAWTSM
jgi:hypothetical protein